jgi:hypothetical protein
MQHREGRIEMARRHVQQAEAQVERQYGLIERLYAQGLPTGRAEAFLQDLKASLRDRHHRLAEVLQQRSVGLRDRRGNLNP